jgi:hypothetical protein
VSKVVRTRTVTQVRSHAQKFFEKRKRQQGGEQPQAGGGLTLGSPEMNYCGPSYPTGVPRSAQYADSWPGKRQRIGTDPRSSVPWSSLIMAAEMAREGRGTPERQGISLQGQSLSPDQLHRALARQEEQSKRESHTAMFPPTFQSMQSGVPVYDSKTEDAEVAAHQSTGFATTDAIALYHQYQQALALEASMQAGATGLGLHWVQQ